MDDWAERCLLCRRKRGLLMVVHYRPDRRADGAWISVKRCASRSECDAYRRRRRAAAADAAERRAQRPADLELRELHPRERGRCRWCGDPIFRVNKHGLVVVDRRREWHEGREVHPDAEPEPRCVQEHNAQGFTFRDAIFKRDHGVCASCGRDCEAEREAWYAARPGYAPEVTWEQRQAAYDAWRAAQPPGWQADHVVALEDGGEHLVANGQTLCDPCHAAKTARENSERAARRRGDLPVDQLELSA